MAGMGEEFILVQNI